jgi:thiol-disulfide isomerase/thioredoxin
MSTDPTPAAPSFVRRNLPWLLAGAILVGWLAIVRSGANRGAAGARADFAWPLVDLEGKPLDLGQFQGKAIFLNVWATWCPPCVREMPSIERLAANPRLQGKPVAIVAVSVGEDAQTVRDFVASRGIKAITVLQADEPPPVFTTQGIPATFLIAPDGTIAESHIGSQEWDGPDTISRLEQLAAQPAT